MPLQIPAFGGDFFYPYLSCALVLKKAGNQRLEWLSMKNKETVNSRVYLAPLGRLVKQSLRKNDEVRAI